VPSAGNSRWELRRIAPLVDVEQLSQIQEALRERRVDGFVVWKPIAIEWLLKNLDGHTDSSITTLMHEHVGAGGEVDRVPERREGYRDRFEFHYDFRLKIDGRKVYIETRLRNTKTGPILTIVNIHDE